MNCPSPKHKTPVKMDKVRLDCYGCVVCGHRYLIHPYRSQKHPGVESQGMEETTI
jgi:hypothetical protein